MTSAETMGLKSPGGKWFKDMLDPMFPPQAPGRFWPSGGLRREAGTWVVTIEWPREKYWGQTTVMDFNSCLERQRCFTKFLLDRTKQYG